MIEFLKTILVARGIAAAFAILTAVFAAAALPSQEYAIAALAIATAAIGVALFYFPFSKYVLISRNHHDIESLFWKMQIIVAPVILLMAMIWVFATGQAASLGGGVALYAISQGWKEFTGEVLRVSRNSQKLTLLYLGDAITTLLFTIGALHIVATGTAWIVSSACSSLIWSLGARDRGQSKAGNSESFSKVISVYRYSIGVVGGSGLNAAAVAMMRSMIIRHSPTSIAGAIQFLLDFLQKPMALLASATVSAAVPEAKNHGVDSLKRHLLPLFGAAFAGLLIVSIVVQFIPMRAFANIRTLPWSTIFACVMVIWINRFKSSTLDLPLTCSESGTAFLLIGAASAVLVIWGASQLRVAADSAVHLAVLAFFIGGTVNGMLAIWRRACRASYFFLALALALAAWITTLYSPRLMGGGFTGTAFAMTLLGISLLGLRKGLVVRT